MKTVRLSIDPSIHHTGYALWEESTWGTLVPPVVWGIMKSPSSAKAETWMAAANMVVKGLMLRIRMNGQVVTHAYIEQPKFMSDNASGQAAAKSDSIIKLAYSFGAIGYALCERGIPMTAYRVEEWKGQLPKSVVWQRVVDRLGRFWEPVGVKEPVADAQDAVGIGLHAQGLLHIGIGVRK